VFHEPYQAFYNILVAHPPTPLPTVRKRPVPPIEYPISTTFPPGESPEFTTTMERDEADRLEVVRKMFLSEADKMRQLILDKEKELEQLKRQTAA
ncbi:hypothetical protein M422DRAFT_197039, partial [Sphaerobolus stellatus SS14]